MKIIDTHAFRVAKRAYKQEIKNGKAPLYLKQHLVRMIHINQQKT